MQHEILIAIEGVIEALNSIAKAIYLLAHAVEDLAPKDDKPTT